MPSIATFYGIVILMYVRGKEHNPPHIHARYQDYEASFFIENGELYEGSFPNKGQKLVKEFVLKYQKELQEMWDTQTYKKLPPLD